MKYKIGDLYFESKKKIQEHVKSILYGQMYGSVKEEHQQFMQELLQGHPEAEQKIGVGINHIAIEKDIVGKRCFVLYRVDGTRTDFSYISCLSGKQKTNQCFAAMRYSILEQTLAFKRGAFSGKEVIECPFTKEKLKLSTCHVDHIPPDTFLSIAKSFLKLEGLNESNVGVSEGDGVQVPVMLDLQLEKRWKDYHAKNAKLRIVSRTANLSIIPKLYNKLKKEKVSFS